MNDIQDYLDYCKKWLVEQIEEEASHAGSTGYGCQIYTRCFYANVYFFTEPFHIESLAPKHAVGRMLIRKKGVFAGTSYLPAAKKIMIRYGDLDIGTLEQILGSLRPDFMVGRFKPCVG